LWRLQDEGWLDPQLAAEEFQDSLRLKLAAYPFPDRWVSFWRHVLRRDHQRGDIGGWVQGPLPQVAAEQRQKEPQRQVWASYDPEWATRSTAIVERLRKGVEGAVEGAVEEAEQLLAEQRGYFDRSGDSNNLVRSATRFSAAVRRNRPALALEWARLAKEVEPWDGFAWTNEGAALLAGRDLPGASAVYREAVGRFPNDAVARNGLAGVLKALDRPADKEQEYPESKAQLPNEVIAPTGFDQVSMVQDKPEQAATEYRETQARVPEEVVTHTGAAEAPRMQDGPQEATVVATAVAEPSISPTDHERTDAAPREASVEAGLGRREIELIANDAFLVRRWARTTRTYSPDLAPGHFRDRAEDLLKQLLPATDRDSIAAGEVALLELDRGELEQALALLRRAVERFPGSARVRYALARAEREAPQGDPITPWRRLLRLDEHYEPIFFLGAGRAYLHRAINGDGNAMEKARDKLGRLAYWIRQRTLIDADRAPNDPQPDPRSCFRARHQGDFAGWWAVEAQAELFGPAVIEGYDDLGDLGPIMERASAHDSGLDRLEEELMLRYARA